MDFIMKYAKYYIFRSTWCRWRRCRELKIRVEFDITVYFGISLTQCFFFRFHTLHDLSKVSPSKTNQHMVPNLRQNRPDYHYHFPASPSPASGTTKNAQFMKKPMYLKTQHSHAQKYGNFNDMQSILIFVDPIKIKYTQVSAYSLTLCCWRWITHLGTNLSNDYHVRTLLKGYYNILGTICLKTKMIIFETL